MSLLNPLLFALGAAALTIPLWVHLRLGKVKKRATVGSLRLLRATPQTSRSPRRLIQRPLLALRCLITLLIALGFARLLLPWLGKDTSVESTAIVLDISGSMQAKNGASSSWQLARDAALAHLDRLAPSARVAVILSPSNDTKPEWTDPGTARAAIRKLKGGFAANQLHSDILTAVTSLRAMPDDQPKILHVISDFQRSSFVGIDQAAIPQNVQLKLTKTSPEKPTNRGVAVTVTQAGATNLRLYAFNDATPGNLTLTENDSPKTSPVTAGRILTVKPPAARPDGTVSRKLGIAETDDLAADNTAIDVFHPQPEIPVWLWQPRSTSNRSETEQATYFLARALQPSENPNESISRFRPRAIAEDALADATPPPLLIIPAQDNYPEALAKLANDITAQGGAVVFFGGKNLTASSLAPFGKLPPAIPDGIEDIPSSPALATIHADHSLFGSLSQESRLRLAASPLLQRHILTVSPASRVLAKFADAKPFIVEADAGRGKTYFVNTSADREFGDWAADAPRFIPAVHLLAAKAVAEKFHTSDDTPFLAGESRDLRLDRALAGKTVEIEGTKHAVQQDGTVPALVFPEPGEKSILAEGKPVQRLAVNFPPQESALDNLSETVVRQRLESQRLHEGGNSVRWENTTSGQIAWQLCLLFGSLLLLVEPFIADRKPTR
jgi:hypothetical protein